MGKKNIEESLLNLPLWIRILIVFYYVLVVIQNPGASFPVIALSTSSAALDLDVQVYIDVKKAQSILGDGQSTH